MVKIAAVVLFVLLCAIPVMAQEDYPKVQTSFGYANLGFVDFGNPNLGFTTTAPTSRHSGFANETSLNFTRSLGFSNYMGLYGLGGGVTLIADFIGGKAMYRTSHIVPYGTAGIGFGYGTSACYSYYSCGGSFATRYGGGFDVPFKESLAWKFEISRMSFHQQFNVNSAWTSGTNFQTGIVFTILQ
jgi:hypothetical protein